MPENPNIDPESGSNGFYNANVTMATTNNNRNNNRNQGIPRISSAGIKYYDIATQLLGKNGSDLEELFIAAARDGVYEKIENFLHRNRSDYVVSIDVKDKKTGNTPLIWAAKRGHAKIVQLLLRHGADITLRNYEGQTALEVASPSIRSILLESVERTTEASHQLLLQAAWQGDIQVVSRLLSQKKVLDINCQNADGFTPVMLATRDMQLFEKLSSQMSRNYNPIEVVTELLTARADLHASDGDGKSCVHHASQSKAQIAQSVLSSIISGAPNLEQKDKRSFAPLHCASLTGNADCISALLDGGSDVNSRGFAGATALHITSYNNHEKATTVLLEHGANVTLTDDRGLTPLDFAKTRKMKKKLQEAWAEVKSSKSTTSLGPIRAHSREDLRSSVEDLTKKRSKGKGEVIFEGLPNNPFSDSNKKDTMSKLRRSKSLRDLGSLRIDMLPDVLLAKNLDITFPRYKKDAKGLTRHLSLKEKSRGEDEFPQGHLRDNVRKLGQVRNQKPSPLPRTKSRSTERLPVISPDRVSSDRNLESPVMFGRNSRLRRSFEDRKNGRGRKVNSLTARESSNLTDDVFERFSPAPVSPTPSHRRSESDPNRGTPNLIELAASCEPYLHGQKRGRSYSVNSNPANDLEANRYTPNQREFTPFQREGTTTTLQREATLMSICSYRTESRMSTNSNSPRMLNLGQMLSKNKTPVQHLYGPGSSKVIPPTPTFITQRSESKSESDVSPRSDDDSEANRDPPELVRSRSIYKDEFILEESRPKDPFIRTPSTGSDTVSSSGSSLLSSSPRDTPLSVKGNNTRKTENSNTVKPKQVTGNSANIVGSMKVGASKINEKFASNVNGRKNINSVQNGSGLNSGDDSKGGDSVPKLKISNAVSVGNSKYGSVLHTMAVRNAAAQNASKVNSSNTNGAKSGGKITVHGINGENDNKNVDKAAPADQTPSESLDETVKTVRAGVKGNDNSKVNSKTAEIKSSAQASNAKKKAAQKMQNVLQVVPTKLTENIVRTAPKGNLNTDKSTAKTVSVKTADKVNTNKSQKQEVVSNVNMHLSQSAQVQSRIVPQENNKTKLNEASTTDSKNGSAVVNKPTISNSGQGVSKVESKNGQTNIEKNENHQVKPVDNISQVNSKTSKNVSAPQSSATSNKFIKQSTSADISNRQGAQSRNSTFHVSKSASVNQRQVGNVRKTTSSYTPRFPTNNNISKQKSNLSDKSEGKENKQTDNNTSAVNNATKTKSDTNTDNSATVKTIASTSPTDLVTTAVSKSASIMKSYNMSGVPSTSKSTNNSSLTSDSSTATNKPGVSDIPAKKNQVLSKSVQEPLQRASKVSNASIVSSSVSQMPSVGTVTNDKSHSKGLLRSASMTTIDEAKEKKLMSSSDTKIQCASNTNNGRPSSDTPTGSAGTKDKHNNGNAPLVEIMPECAPRINKKNYMDMNNPMTTPVIVNPFEELEQKRALTATEFGFVVDKPSVERSKTQVSLKGKNAKSQKKTVTSAKPSSASTRGSSARKKRSKSKDANKSDNESRPKSGKSGRRVRSAKRKRKIPSETLAKENEKPDVALIGGIGWQIATSCIDKSEADAVVVSQIDSSESEGEDVSIFRLASPVNFEMSDNEIQVPNALDVSSSLYSPRFREVRPSFQTKHEEDLPMADNDGYRPMNLDMTQNSLSQQNRAGVILKQDMPGDISNFLSKLREDQSDILDDDNDSYDDEDDYGDEDNIEDMLHRQVMIGQLTPIPESPSLTNTNSTLKHVAKTVDAINRFDQNIKDDDLSKLLGSTPRNKASASSDRGSANMTRSGPVKNSGGSLRSAVSQKESKQCSSGSAMSRSLPSRNSSSKTNMSRISNLSSEIREKASKVFGNAQLSPNAGSTRDSNSRGNSVNKSLSNSLRKSSSREKLYLEKDKCQDNEDTGTLDSPRNDMNSETKERIDSKILDLKKMLADKMQKTQKLLNDSTQNNSYKKKKQSEMAQANNETCENEVKLNISELTEENLKAFDTARTDDDMKSTRSSRKERRYSETKKVEEKDEDIKEAIDEILSNTFPSSRSNMRSVNSFKSVNSTLTEADRKVLKKMVQENHHASPFHAKGSVRVSSSYEDSVTLNKDNPELLKRFNTEKFEMGQRMKAMIDAGADKSKVKAMVKADNNEAKQLARIMNSFRQMELYAGPHSSNNNRSAKKETPRREGEHVHKSLSRFDNPHSSHQMGMPPRPGSAGAGRMKPGKFTEIKGGKSASHVGERSNSPVDVPKNLADEFKRSPFREVSSLQEGNIDELANVIKITSQSSEDDHVSLEDEEMERADSACTTLSSHSSIMEETIQWKKGNVLGKGAFGTVWCGLTSEGQLIAVKQIELNTTNQNKAKKEYEKVQEEVELLKTLEHKNIVGYLGTSLEDSVVSIFMQFVPGGSIASILARFGALDEAVFRKYTKQILEGVEYLHANDVIHRDIKGGNVMLMPNGVIKLIDFGCAKRLCINLSMGQSQILKSMKGTPYWMAPEVVNETGHGKKSDIWSVGCTVFEMATRKPPWADMNPMAAIFAIGSDKPVPQLPEKFTEEAVDFVNCCLTKDQAKRLSATQLLQTTFMRRRSKKNSSNC